MIAAWKDASTDLGIDIEAPFNIGGEQFPLLIKHFGSKFGTVIIDMNDTEFIKRVVPSEYHISELNPEVYELYNREEFIDTLEDWGWFGPESERPDWYTDKYYKRNDNL